MALIIETILIMLAVTTIVGFVAVRNRNRRRIARQGILPDTEDVGQVDPIAYHLERPEVFRPHLYVPTSDTTIIIGLGRETPRILAMIKDILSNQQNLQRYPQKDIPVHFLALAQGKKDEEKTVPCPLKASEYRLLSGRDVDEFIRQVEENRNAYPYLSQWLGLFKKPGKPVSLSIRCKARLALLRDALSLLPELEPKCNSMSELTRVYLIADMGDPMGAGLLTDIAWLLSYAVGHSRSSGNGNQETSPGNGNQAASPPPSLYGFLLLPDANAPEEMPEHITDGSVFAAWRELDLAQIVFGRYPSAETGYSAWLTNSNHDIVVLDNDRLFNRCWLIETGQTPRLPNIPISQGVSPMIADTIVSHLHIDASSTGESNQVRQHRNELAEHHQQVNETRNNRQRTAEIPLYSSIGTFTYHFPIEQISSEIIERAIRDLLYHSFLANKQDEQLNTARYLRDTPLGASWHLAASPPKVWEPGTVLKMADCEGWLHQHRFPPQGYDPLQVRYARTAQLGKLSGILKQKDFAFLLAISISCVMFAVPHPYIISAGVSLVLVLLAFGCGLINNEKVVEEKSDTYIREHLRDRDGKGKRKFETYLDECARKMFATEQNRLIHFVCEKLNEGVHLPAMGNFLESLSSEHWGFIAQRLDAYGKECKERAETTNEQRERAWQETHLNCFAKGIRFSEGLRWFSGYTTTHRQERALKAVQEYIDAEIDRMVAEKVQKVASDLTTCSKELLERVSDYQKMLEAEVRRVDEQMKTFRQERRKQLDFCRVRHEWGQPYTRLYDYRDYFDNEDNIPSGEKDREIVQGIRDYLAGKHVDWVYEQSQREILLEQATKQIRWKCAMCHDENTSAGQPATTNQQSTHCTVEGLLFLSTPSQESSRDVESRPEPEPLNQENIGELVRQVFSRTWELSLGDVMAMAKDTPFGIAPDHLGRLVAEQNQFGLRIRGDAFSTPVTYTLAILPKMNQNQAGHTYFEQVKESHCQNISTGQCRYFRGGDPFRFVVMAEGEFLGIGNADRARSRVCEKTDLPSYRNLARHYWANREKQPHQQFHLDIPHTIAAYLEGMPPIGERCLSMRLIACFHDMPRLECFARLVLLDRIDPFIDEGPASWTTVTVRVWEKHQEGREERVPLKLTLGQKQEPFTMKLKKKNNDDPSRWIMALRSWCLDESKGREIEAINARLLEEEPDLADADRIFDRLKSSNQLQMLRESSDIAEKDLGLAIEALFNRLYDL